MGRTKQTYRRPGDAPPKPLRIQYIQQMETPASQCNKMPEKRPAEDGAGSPAPKAPRTALAPGASPSASTGGAAGAPGSAGAPAPGGGPPPRSSASPEVPASSKRPSCFPRAFVAAPGVSLDPVRKASAAALAANTFAKKVVQVQDFRCYVQTYYPGKPWTAQEYPWEEVLPPSYRLTIGNLSGGVFIFPSVDTYSRRYKMVPFGDTDPAIRDYYYCGASGLPVGSSTGSSFEWRFDHQVRFSSDEQEMSFMVVKVPGSPPPSLWNGSAADEPEIQTSLDVEKLVRAKFFIQPDEKLEKPCWLNTTVVRSELDSWKKAANASDAMYRTLFENYSALQSDYVKLAVEKDELQTKHDEVVHQRLELTSNNLDTQKAMKELQEKHNALVQEQVQRRTDNQEMATALYDIHKATECCICFEPLSDGAPCSMGLPCGHVFHAACHEKQKRKNVCAHCQGKVSSWHEFHGFTAISTILKKFNFPEQ